MLGFYQVDMCAYLMSRSIPKGGDVRKKNVLLYFMINRTEMLFFFSLSVILQGRIWSKIFRFSSYTKSEKFS
jgi:hypothetical protein